MATNIEIKTAIDTDITNKILPNSVTNTNVGERIKDIVDYVVQEITTLTPTYNKYVALLTQSGLGAPIVTSLLENSLSAPIIWTRSSAGVYIGTLTGEFTNLKTFCMICPISVAGDWSLFPATNNTIELKTWNNVTNAFADGYLNETSIEIRVYN